jgi:integrase
VSDRLYQREPDGIFYGVVYDAQGNRHRFSTRCTDLQAASLALQREERAAQASAAYRLQQNHYTLQNAVDDLLRDGCLDCAADTISFYRIKAGHLIRLLGADLLLENLTSNLVRDFIRKRQDEGAKDMTVVKEVITLRRAVKLAHEAGHFNANPKDVIPRFRVRYQPRERWLTPEELRKLLRKLRIDRRLWVMIATFSGARFSEVERLRWEHVDLERGWVLLPGTKTAKSRRRVPLAAELATVLKSQNNKGEHVVRSWPNVVRDLACACRRAGIPKVSPNDLRRTFASWLKQAGTDSLVVAKLLGHSTTRMVELVYGHLSTKQYELAVSTLPGLSRNRKKAPKNSPRRSAGGTAARRRCN